MARFDDASEYRFFSLPNAVLDCSLHVSSDGRELRLFGNRAGILSLANNFLWFLANSWRREFLSLGELPFVRMHGKLAVSIRMTDSEDDKSDGTVRRTDHGESLEWSLSDSGLRQVSLNLHRLASKPSHEYDRLLVTEASECGVHVRMTDAVEWIDRGIA